MPPLPRAGKGIQEEFRVKQNFSMRAGCLWRLVGSGRLLDVLNGDLR